MSIFPVLFSFGQSPTGQNSGLLFEIMPELLAKLPFGQMFGFMFFLDRGKTISGAAVKEPQKSRVDRVPQPVALGE